MDIDTAAIRRLRDALIAHQGETTVAASDDQDLAVMRRVEPFAETMFLVMVADDEPAGVEHDALAAAVEILTDARISRTGIAAMLERFHASAAQSGVESRVAQLGAQLGRERDDREIAFTLAAAIALADSRVDHRENRVLQMVREYFGVSDRRAEALLGSIDAPD